MNKLGKISKKIQGKKFNNNNNSGGQDLEEVVKDATAKALTRPDPDLNQRVADVIGSACHTEGVKRVATILTDRLKLNNPHKVWLAIQLIQEVLRKCEAELKPVQDDIMFEVGKVAGQAMNRFNSNLADQQRAKSAAFELLKRYGHDGHTLSQPTVNHGRFGEESATSSPSPAPRGDQGSEAQAHKSWQELSEAVQSQIAVAISHNDLLQDILLDTSPFESRTPEQRTLAKDIILEATQFRHSFEQLLTQLSAYDNPEASNLMTAALERMDTLNSSLNLHKDTLKKQLKDQRQRRTISIPAFQAAPASRNPSHGTQYNAAYGDLTDLQQGLQPTHSGIGAWPGGPTDMYDASRQWQQQQQQQQQPRPYQPHLQPMANPFGQATSWGPQQAFHGRTPGSPGYGYGQMYGGAYGPGQQVPYQGPPGGYGGHPIYMQGYGPQPGWGPSPPYGFSPHPSRPQPNLYRDEQQGPAGSQQPPAGTPPSMTQASIDLVSEIRHDERPSKASNEVASQPAVAPSAPQTPPASQGVSSGHKPRPQSSSPDRLDLQTLSLSEPNVPSTTRQSQGQHSGTEAAGGVQYKAAAKDEWDWFFSERNEASGNASKAQKAADTLSKPSNGFDELSSARRN